jgi:hypothetical protein
MIKKRDVFLKVCTEHSRFTTCFVDNGNIYGLGQEIYLSVYKMAPEDVVHLVKAARKYYDLVVL